jgi:hypothetical protein
LLLELDIDLIRDLNGPAHKASFAERSDALEWSPSSCSLAVGILQQLAETVSTRQRMADRLTWLEALTLLVDERAVPGEDSVRLGNGRELFQRLLAELLADLSQYFAIAVRQVQPTVDLLAEEAVLSYQILVAQPELFVNRLGD